MPLAVDVLVRPEYLVSAVDCHDDHPRWSAMEAYSGHNVVLVRRGRFRREVEGERADVDPTLGYVGAPGQEERFAHPSGGDQCTLLSLSPGLWSELAGSDVRPSVASLYVDGRLDLAHRRLLVAARAGDVDDAASHALLELIGVALARTVAGPTRASMPRSDTPTQAGVDRRLVAVAREALAAGHPAASRLFPLAELLGVSPYRLSRAFTRQLGLSLTHYRNRVRAGMALDRLAAGEPSLARLAAELGFADQAHLSRTVREHVGYPPAALRRLLADPIERAGAESRRGSIGPGHE